MRLLQQSRYDGCGVLRALDDGAPDLLYEATTKPPVLMLLSGGSSAYVVVSLVASLMVLWRHRSNIERLIAGTEPKIGQKA